VTAGSCFRHSRLWLLHRGGPVMLYSPGVSGHEAIAQQIVTDKVPKTEEDSIRDIVPDGGSIQRLPIAIGHRVETGTDLSLDTQH
jgi:hypothetical protein